MVFRSILATCLALAVAPTLGCGSDDVELTDGGPGGGDDADPGGSDGSTATADAGPGGPCTADGTECNNCMDDDGDGLIDGDDPECTGALDDREDSFATGIPGDNSDAVKQDCFYDGNSGSGADDPCDVHVCCLIAPDPADCDALDLGGPAYDPETCEADLAACATGDCTEVTPPGCDCLGCCTVCGTLTPDGEETCTDIYTGPAGQPKECFDNDPDNDPETCCTAENLENCLTCEKSSECTGGECDTENCILCPGQTEEDLPDTCNDMNECNDGATPCDTSDDCSGSEYCSVGCCVLGGVD